jgi:hypothetical protein
MEAEIITVKSKVDRLVEKGILYALGSQFKCTQKRALSLGRFVEIVDVAPEPIPEPPALGKKKAKGTSITGDSFDSKIDSEDGFRG